MLLNSYGGDIMEHQEDLGRLEKTVERLLTGFKDAKQEKMELESHLEQKETLIKELRDEINALKDDRSGIHKRVAGLVESIEEWERGQSTMEQRPIFGEGVQPPAD